MRIIDQLYDPEIIRLKEDYTRLFGKNPPPFHFEEYLDIPDYKEQLKKLVSQKEPLN